MAVDEALLRQAAEQDLAALRFYQWRTPALSLGYFQSHADRFFHAQLANVDVVRRFSGGGALLHDRELTYSICLPASHRFARNSDQLYREAHQSWIQALQTLGVRASLDRDAAVARPRAQATARAEPFFCFQRRSEMDVLLRSPVTAETVKIVGSAQRKRRGAVLQHGAVLLGASPLAPHMPGILEATRVAADPDHLRQQFGRRLCAALALEPNRAENCDSWRPRAKQLASEKYACDKWTERR